MGHGHHPHDSGEDIRHLHQHALEAKRDLQHIKDTLAVLRASIGRIEKSVGLQQAADERMEKRLMAVADQLTADATKFEEFTTSYGTTIDTAVARILSEIGKQGSIPPEVQAAADHLSVLADNLIAANATNLQRIMDAGSLPPDVPPAPEPIPEPPAPIEPDPNAPTARRR